jgi:hypothetical protein
MWKDQRPSKGSIDDGDRSLATVRSSGIPAFACVRKGVRFLIWKPTVSVRASNTIKYQHLSFLVPCCVSVSETRPVGEPRVRCLVLTVEIPKHGDTGGLGDHLGEGGVGGMRNGEGMYEPWGRWSPIGSAKGEASGQLPVDEERGKPSLRL